MVHLSTKLKYFFTILALLLTFLVTSYTYQQHNEKEQARFNINFKQIILQIHNRMNIYKQIMYSGVGLFNIKEDIRREDWKKFIDSQKIEVNFPGIQGVGYAVVIKPEDLESHIKSIQNEGFKNYHIKPEGKRDLYTSIIYLEPFDERNKRAFGYDMFSNEIRNIAMTRAYKTGKLTMSGKVRLVQENGINEQAGFLMYIPVYKKNMPLETQTQRLAALKGFVYEVFRANNLMRGIAQNLEDSVDIEIYDGEEAKASALIYDSNEFEHNQKNTFSEKTILEIGGHKWLIVIKTLKKFDNNFYGNTYLYPLFFGLILTLLFFIFMDTMIKKDKQQKEFINSLKTMTLKKSLALRTGSIGIWEWDYKEKKLIWNDPMFEIYEFNQEDDTDIYNKWITAIDESYAPSIKKALDNLMNFNGEFNISFWVTTQTGKRKYIKALGINELDEYGNPIRIVGTNQDITEFKLTVEKLNDLNNSLEDKIKSALEENTKQLQLLQQQSKLASMGEMIGAIAHQWRQPLNEISISIQNLEYDYKDGVIDENFLKDFINQNEQTISFMSKTIDDFRNFFRTNKNKSNFKIKESIESVISMQSSQLKNYEIKVTIEGDDFEYYGIDSEFKQVILNIIRRPLKTSFRTSSFLFS